MFQQSLKKSTRKLQDDLRQTMKTYASEKAQLLQQLSLLKSGNHFKNSEMTSSSTSVENIKLPRASIKHDQHSRFYPAPDRMARRSKPLNQPHSESFINERVASSQSGCLHANTQKPRGRPILPCLRTAPEISLSKTNVKMLRVPGGKKLTKRLPPLDQTESLDYIKWKSRSQSSLANQKQGQKHVQFQGVLYRSLPSVSEYLLDETDSDRLLMDNNTSPHSHARGGLKRENRTLSGMSDVVHAVRVRISEDGQKLMYGERPRPVKRGSSLCDYLLPKTNQEPEQEQGKKSKDKVTMVTGAPAHTAGRLGRRSNAVQLQNYLRRCSQSRRMVEHMEAEEYRYQQEQLG